MSIRSNLQLGARLNKALQPFGIYVMHGSVPSAAIKPFISARKTMAAAKKKGVPLGTYVDDTYGQPGGSAELVKALLELASFPGKVGTVCEIGPGTARYAEKIIDALHPDVYEMYETARDWLPHLRTLPNALLRDANGRTLSQTPDASVDLVHSIKTFVYLEFFVIAGYLQEMARVVRPGGIVAFDVTTEDCMDEETVRIWVRDGTIYHPFPKEWCVEYMRRRGLTLIGSHFTQLPPGRAELLVFRRDDGQ